LKLHSHPLAALAGVTKSFGTHAALRGLDLQVNPGEVLSLLGPNGAGKTTAISILLGLLKADSGTVRLMGRSPRDLQARRQIGVMMQDVSLMRDMRVRELIRWASSYYPGPMSIDQALTASNTAALADRSYGKLSGGQKRQVQFAIAICGRPRLLFLDEPTVGLDVEARRVMWNTLRALVKGGVSIVLTTHYIEEAEFLSDRVAVLVAGRVVASGSVQEIRKYVRVKHIRCATEVATIEIDAWPEVVKVSHNGAGLEIVARNAESVARQLLGADPRLADLEIRRAGLAEAFVELVKEEHA
jgi:ABC-type multidrug transport system ATPase subunit